MKKFQFSNQRADKAYFVYTEDKIAKLSVLAFLRQRFRIIPVKITIQIDVCYKISGRGEMLYISTISSPQPQPTLARVTAQSDKLYNSTSD